MLANELGRCLFQLIPYSYQAEGNFLLCGCLVGAFNLEGSSFVAGAPLLCPHLEVPIGEFHIRQLEIVSVHRAAPTGTFHFFFSFFALQPRGLDPRESPRMHRKKAHTSRREAAHVERCGVPIVRTSDSQAVRENFPPYYLGKANSCL